MKITGKLLLFLSALWLLLISLQPFGPFLRPILPQATWVRLLFSLPEPPPPYGRFTLLSWWPVLAGFGGAAIGVLLAEIGKRCAKGKLTDEL